MKQGRVESASLFIGKVARRPGVGVETTRFYERQGLLTPPVRKDPGYRLYPEQVFGRSRFIRRANELGFSLSEITELLEVQTNSSARCEDVCEKAEAKIANIERKIDMLTKMKLCSPPEGSMVDNTDGRRRTPYQCTESRIFDYVQQNHERRARCCRPMRMRGLQWYSPKTAARSKDA
jgi:DNA-binding transcriptional MerR regulator